MRASLLIFGLLVLFRGAVGAQEVNPRSIGPFPLTGPIYGPEGEEIAQAKVYPRYVEIFNGEGQFLTRVGILVEKGKARVYIVQEGGGRVILGSAHQGVIYDRKDKPRGSYFWTPTYSYVYTLDGKRAGSTKCIAWPRVCAVGVAGFLLKLYLEEGKKSEPSP